MVGEVDKLLQFLKQAFGAVQTERVEMPGGRLHAEVRIGDSIIMMGSATGGSAPMPSMLYVYTDDTDAAYTRALKAGATSVMEPADQFYGDRNAGVKDALGNLWWIATHKEDVSKKELEKRAAALPVRT